MEYFGETKNLITSSIWLVRCSCCNRCLYGNLTIFKDDDKKVVNHSIYFKNNRSWQRHHFKEQSSHKIFSLHLLTYFKETYYGKMHGRKNRYVQAHLHQKFICYPKMAYAQHKVPVFIKNSLMLSSLQITKNKIP